MTFSFSLYTVPLGVILVIYFGKRLGEIRGLWPLERWQGVLSLTLGISISFGQFSE